MNISFNTKIAHLNIFCKRYSFILLVFAMLVALIVRSAGLYPVVFADEYVYSRFSRHIPFSDIPIPNYLYLLTYRSTNYCGAGFLDCARVINSLLFVSAAPFIYLTARTVCSRSTASILTLLALFSPVNTYTVFFMPESFYFLAFWAFSWLILKLSNESNNSSWISVGILLGTAALIKPHALTLLPFLLVYILFTSGFPQKYSLVKAFSRFTLVLIACFSIKLFLGHLIAGMAGVTVAGPLYSSVGSDAVPSDALAYIALIKLALINLQGHILGLCLMFGLPVVFMCQLLLRLGQGKSQLAASERVSIYAATILGGLVIFVAFFTASVAGAGQYESVSRIHMRYYSFAFPLFYIIVASRLNIETVGHGKAARAVLACPAIIIILYAMYTYIEGYSPTFVDSPAFRGYTSNSNLFYLLGSFSLFSLILFVLAERYAARFFLYCLLPLMAGVSTLNINEELRQLLVPDAYDDAGVFANHYFDDEDASKLVVIGSSLAGLSKTLFHLDNPDAVIEEIPKGAPYNTETLHVDTDWILIVGHHELQKKPMFQMTLNGFTIARIKETSTLDFRKSNWPGVIVDTKGLTSPDTWGTWSDGNLVDLEFVRPLPEKFNLHLTAHMFDPDTNSDFVVTVGNSSEKFSLAATHTTVQSILILNPSRADTIEFHIPNPVSPKTLGRWNDDTRLGIKFVELKIEPL